MFHIFKNTGELHNDVVLPGSPFRTDAGAFKFTLHPRTKFFRFGIRLSKTADIEFYHPQQRYEQPHFGLNYIDIHIGVGKFTNTAWHDENKIHVAQYNVEGFDHIFIEQEYLAETKLEWNIHFDQETGWFSSTFEFEQLRFHPSQTGRLRLPKEYKYFKVFAWADKVPFHIECEITTPLLLPVSQDDFRVGNIHFRKGDIFDYASQKMANVFVLPASDQGAVTPHILNRALELGIPNPENFIAGKVKLYPVTSSSQWMLAGYAYSIQKTVSREDIINDVAINLHASLTNNKEFLEKTQAVSLPLFGTGTGKLNPVSIADIYDQVFNSERSIKYIVSILDNKAFVDIKEFFAGRYRELQSENGKEAIPENIKHLSAIFRIDINQINYRLNDNKELTSLTLYDTVIEGGWPRLFKSLTELSFYNCRLENLSFVLIHQYLKRLNLSSCTIYNTEALELAKHLTTLELTSTPLISDSFLSRLTALRVLKLRNMSLINLDEIFKLKNIEELDLRSCVIEDLEGISNLRNLKKLYLPYNQVTSLEPLRDLKQIEILDVSNNMIEDLAPIAALKKLKILRINNNPAITKEKILLDETDNHLLSVLNLLSKKAEQDLINIRMPCKILLLGNHESGKSSLLDIIQGREQASKGSTHIIKVEKFPTNDPNLPKAIFFDFGGQDYYHGLYRAFLSGGSAYLLVFDAKRNKNIKRVDTNGILTQDFSLQYWLSQKHYFEKEVFKTQNDPIFLIQTHADQHPRMFSLDLAEDIHDTHYVCLTKHSETLPVYKQKQNKNNLAHLIQSITNYINFASEANQRPRWFGEFVLNILKRAETATHLAIPINNLMDDYARTTSGPEQDRLYLQDDLDQLHKQGLVLYYKDHLPDIIWLNPVAVVNYVHDKVLVKDTLAGKTGISVDDVQKFDANIIQLLNLQKVLFLHESGKDTQYIVPNFLPLFEEEVAGAGLLMFGLKSPCIVLKFKNFLPFGLINQLICFFGLLPEDKRFWRDKLMFKIDNNKVLIELDMQSLEIKIYTMPDGQSAKKDSEQVERYIFFSILGQYWNKDILSYNDFVEFEKGNLRKDELPFENLVYQINILESLIESEDYRPRDLFISRDNKNFISYIQLCNSEGMSRINSIERDPATGELSEKINIIEAHPFQLFTKAKLKRSFKAVISYSKQDLHYVNKFRQYLEPLREQGLLDQHWFCTLLLAGQDWNDKIQKEFDEADIIFFMVSENLMTTQYVKDHEIKNAIDKFERGDDVLIIPILLQPYNFKGSGKYDLTRFSALPYSLKAITQFPNQNLGWHVVSELIRITLERKIDPSKINDPFYPQLDRYLDKIVNEDKVEETEN